MMKRPLLLLLLMALFPGLSLFAFAGEDGAVSDRSMERVVAMLKRLHEARAAEDYVTADYFAELQSVGKEIREQDPKRVEALNAATQVDAGNAMLRLAADFRDEDFERARELGEIYGRRAKPRSDGPLPRGMGQPPELAPEHLKPAYLIAWEAWWMAPPSLERTLMRPRLYKALERFHDESAIPLIKESFKIETDRLSETSAKLKASISIANHIDICPGAVAFDALLECNRAAIAGGFAGEGYDGFSRFVVRILTSREAMADEMIDPKMRDLLIRAGRLKKPEDIPLAGDNWKIYKPLVVARLEESEKKDSKVPPEDVAILKAAMEIMPKD
jgi:hypothetical protein